MKDKEKVDAPLLKEYMNALYGGKYENIKHTAKQMGLAVPYIENIVNVESLPVKYRILKDVVRHGGGEEEKLEEIARTEPQVRYKYWSELYPDKPPLSRVGNIISSILEEKNISKQVFVKMIKRSSNFFTLLESGKLKMQYSKFKESCEILGITPKDMLDQIATNTDFEQYNNKLAEALTQARVKRNWTIEQAADHLNMSARKLANAENGYGKLAITAIGRIAETYEIDYRELVTWAYYGQMLSNRKQKLESYFTTTTSPTSYAYGKNLEKYLFNLCRYKYICPASYCPTAPYSRVETHTLVTLVNLILANKASWTEDRYRTEIFYYLKNLRRSGNLAEPLIAGSNLSLKDDGIGAIYEHYLRTYRFTYADIERFSGLTSMMIQARIKTNDFLNVKNCDRLFQFVGVPLSAGCEALCEKYGKSAPKDDDEIQAILDVILYEIDSVRVWRYMNKGITNETLKKMFQIIFDYHSLETERYNRLRELTIEDYSDALSKRRQGKTLPLPLKEESEISEPIDTVDMTFDDLLDDDEFDDEFEDDAPEYEEEEEADDE